MPIVDGPITASGAVVDAWVGVSDVFARALRQSGQPVPPPVPVQAIIDTGASITGFDAALFAQLGLIHVGYEPVLTPSTPAGQPHRFRLYDVSISLIGGGHPRHMMDTRVIMTADFHSAEGATGILGRDVLDFCYSDYHGPNRRFTLAF